MPKSRHRFAPKRNSAPAIGSIRTSMLEMALLLLLLGLLSAVVQHKFFQLAALGPGWEVVSVARNLANNGSFANPFAVLPTGLTAHVAPLYPLLLSLILYLVGDGPQFGVIAFSLAVAMHAVSAVLLLLVSKSLFGDHRPGLIAAVMVIFLPVFVVIPQHETMYVVNALLGLTLLLVQVTKRPHLRWWLLVMCGVVSGFIALFNPATVLVVLPLVVFLTRSHVKSLVSTIVSLVVIALCASLVCSPWILRNFRVFGTFPTMRTNFGLEFHIANNERAKANFMENRESASTHPNVNISEATLYRQIGEVAYNQKRLRAALTWIRQHPGKFSVLTLSRVREFWLPSRAIADPYAWTECFVNLLAVLGVWVMIRKQATVAWMIVSTWILYSSIHSIFQVDIRYTYPIYWLSLLSVGYIVTYMFLDRAGGKIVPERDNT